MKSKLYVLGVVVIVLALLLSSCAPKKLSSAQMMCALSATCIVAFVMCTEETGCYHSLCQSALS